MEAIIPVLVVIALPLLLLGGAWLTGSSEERGYLGLAVVLLFTTPIEWFKVIFRK